MLQCLCVLNLCVSTQVPGDTYTFMSLKGYLCVYMPVFLCSLLLGVCASSECVDVMSVFGCHCEDNDCDENWSTRCSACTRSHQCL